MELRIRDVSKSHSNGFQALKDVTLTIPMGMSRFRREPTIYLRQAEQLLLRATLPV